MEVDEEDEEEEMTEETNSNEQQTSNGENIESEAGMNNADSKATDINPSPHLGRTKSMNIR